MNIKPMLTAVILGCIISGPIEATAQETAVTVSTNLAYDLVGGVNIGAEYPVSDKFSARIDYVFPWYVWGSNTKALQLIHVELGGRYYVGSARSISGLYASAAAGIGYFDIETGGKGNQGEDLMLQLGGGYIMRLRDRWSLDMGLGIGPVLTKYRHYESRGTRTLYYLNSGHSAYFGPNLIRISLSYSIPIKRR